MEEVERLCDRIILLKDGVSRAYGTVEKVQNEFGNVVIHIDHDGIIPLSASYAIVEAGKGHSKLEVTEVTNAGNVLREIVMSGINVQRFARSRKSLDDIFIEVYGDENEKED